MRNAYRGILVDTNILLYAHDPHEKVKGGRAIETLSALALQRRGVVTTQVLGEFFVNACRKLKPPLTPDEAAARVRYFARAWPVLEPTADTVLEAVRGVVEHQFHYYDALIWATAREHRIPLVLSEDCHDERDIEGVLFLNPLKHEFTLEDLV